MIYGKGNLAITFLFLIFSFFGYSQIQLPSLVGDHMVLQQKAEVNLWGWASPNEEISIKLGWQQTHINTTADENGEWKVTVTTPKASNEEYSIILKGKNTIEIHDVLLGEVWLCSGQSNMFFPLGKIADTWKTGVENYEAEVKKANYPQVRLFTVAVDASQFPLNDVNGKWEQCTPNTAYNFSAVAYYFGIKLHKELQVPIGLISSSWGGTKAEAWTAKSVLENNEKFIPILKRYADKQVKYYEDLSSYYDKLEIEKQNSSVEVQLKEPSKGERNKDPYVLYNAMLHPLINYKIKGVIWYQGESNAERAYQYRTLFPAMIKNWRDDWKQEDLPFYFVQIAPHHGQNPEIREAQLMAYRATKNTGMVVTTDVGNPKNIHPIDKKTVGNRLSLWALAKTYGKENVVYSGPLYKSYEVQKAKIQVFFDYAESGLISKGDELTDFEIAGNDQVFYPATAKIKGNIIVVSSPKVKNPVSVRFGWSNSPEPNLFNKEGLPASPFRTDNWPEETYKKY